MSIALAVLFLFGNAIFVGAQFALITSRLDQVEPLAAAGNRRAAVAVSLMRSLDRMLAGSQLGIALCSLGLGAVAEPAFAHQLRRGFDLFADSGRAVHVVAFVLALAFVSFCHMVLGEMVPKNLALAGPVRAALWLGPIMAAWTRVTGPLLTAINGLANGILRLFSVRPQSELSGAYTAQDLSHLVEESAAEGMLDDEQRLRLLHALALEEQPVRQLLLPMRQLVTLAPTARIRDLEDVVRRTGFSRFPVADGRRVVGYVHAKDLLWLDGREPDERLPASAIRPMPELAAEATLLQALEAMQSGRAHMALVTDNGAPTGVVPLEDVVQHLIADAG